MIDILITNIDDEIIKTFIISLYNDKNDDTIIFTNILTNLIKHGKKINKQIIHGIFEKYNYNNLKTRYIQIENDIQNTIHCLVETKLYEMYMKLLTDNNIICNSLVYSGIVKVENNDYNTIVPIAIADGSKCIEKENKIDNITINDTHAEVLVKKCFIYYLINQIELYYNDNQSIFTGKNDYNGLLILKENIKFYLYISKAPCGSFNRIIYNISTNYKEVCNGGKKTSYTDLTNILKNDETVIDILLQLKNKLIGLLNSDTDKIKIPFYYDVSEINRVNKTMSCSDKIMKWILLGIQGSILSSIIEPIFLQSIIIGTGLCFNVTGINLYDNAKKIFDLLKNRLQNFNNDIIIPNIVCTDKIYPTELIANKPVQSSNWVCNNLEIIDGFTGLVNNIKERSRLSKINLINKLTNVKLFVMYKKLFEKNHKLFNINQLLKDNYSKVLNGENIVLSEDEQIFFEMYNIKNISEDDVYEITKIKFLISLFV